MLNLCPCNPSLLWLKSLLLLLVGIFTCNLADAFIQSDLQLIRLSRRHMEQYGVKGLAQEPNSCADLILATPGIEHCGSKSSSLTTTLQAAIVSAL